MASRIATYEVVRELGRGASGAVYHVLQDGHPFALKVIESTDESVPLKVRREAAALARVDHPNLAKVHEVGRHEGRSYIVMELVVGESLARKVKRGGLDEQLVRRIGKRMASALAAVHRHRLVHRDVKPENIVLDVGGEPKLIDFGLVRGFDATDTQDQFAGTLKYASPEHVGMVKRAIDGRSDLYSLGCVLYHCIAGRPPFDDSSALALMRKHAFVIPTSLDKLRSDVSPVLAAVVHKLLAKDPDERYQSAEGLLVDLERLDTLNAAASGGRQIELGTLDVGQRYEAPLIGREDELVTLGRMTGELQGRGAVLVVEGEAGSGKTRLLREWIRTVAMPLLLGGKCQQGDKVPFGPIREALDELLMPLVRRSGDERAAATKRLRRAAGDFAPLIRRLTPAVAALLDTDEAHDGDEADRERFYAAVAHFLAGLAREYGGAIFQVDDIQWLDDASLQVLIRLKRLLDTTPLIIATASRSDAASTAARDRFLAAMSGASLTHLELAPLDDTAVAKLVAVHLGGPKPDAALIGRVAARCRGNPFVLAQYLGALLEGGALQPTTQGWVIDTARLADLSLPDDVLDLIISRLSALSEEATRVLECAAIVGSPFGVDILARVTESSVDRVLAALGDALHFGLVEASGRDSYAFTHDRVEEALRHRLMAEVQCDLHHRVALVLDGLGEQAPGGMRALARHYARGHGDRAPRRLYETCFAAGLYVLENFAIEEGLELLGRASATIEQYALEIPTREQLALTEALGRAHMYVGNHVQAIEYFHRALTLSAATPHDRARLHESLAQLHSEQSHHEQDLQHVLAGLTELGEPLPRSEIEAKASILWNMRMIGTMREHDLGYGAAKGDVLVARKILARLYKHGIYSATYAGRWDQSYLLQARALINAHLLGDRRESIEALATYGSVLAERRYSTARECFERAFRIAEQQGNLRGLAYARLYWAPMHSKLGEIRRGTELSADNFARFIGWLGAFDQIMWAHMSAYDLVCQGKARDALECMRWGLERQRTTMSASENARLLVSVHMPACFAMLGDLREATNRLAELRSIADTTGVTSECSLLELAVLGTTLFVLRETGERGTSLRDALARYKKLGLPARRLPYHYRHHALSAVYAELELFKAAASEAERTALREQLRADVEDAKAGCAQPVFLAHLHCISAAIARLDGDLAAAEQLLGKARREAERSDNGWAALEIATEALELARANHDEAAERREQQVARELVARHGYRHRAKQLAIPLPDEDTQSEVAQIAPAVSDSQSAVSARQLTALLRVSAASSSTLDEHKLIRAALDEVLQILGGDRALLFLVDADGKPRFWIGRDAHDNELVDRSDYNRPVLAKVAATRKPVSVMGREESLPIGSESTAPFELRSIVASPLSNGELFAVLYIDVPLAVRLFSAEDLDTLTALADQIGISIASARNVRLELEHRDREKELELASTVHAMFSPHEPHATVAGVEIAGHSPHDRSNGWWWYGAREHVVTVLVAHVGGQGLASAILPASIATGVRLLTRGTFAVPEVLRGLHEALLEMAGGPYQAAVAALRVDTRARQLELWSTGSPPAVVLAGADAFELGQEGAPLGSTTLSIGHAHRPTGRGDRIYLFADGAVRERLVDIARSTRHLALTTALERVREQLAYPTVVAIAIE